MERTLRVIIGLALIGYGVYSGNVWFYLGIIPLITGIINWCPMKKIMGGCKNGECSSGSCQTDIKSDQANSCCSSSTKLTENSSCCDSQVSQQLDRKSSCCADSKTDEIVIKILGTGCANCIALKKVVDEAIENIDKNIKVMKVEDINEIMKYQIVSTPGLVINEKIKSTGKLLNIQEVTKLIEEGN